LLSMEKMPFSVDKRWWKMIFPTLTHRLQRSPLSRSARVNYSNMDSATSPSAPRRMKGWEAYCEIL
ncbi:MAG: hypothetical protein QF457_11985, partial [SAR324 cluster bacterium]|nr:hypothetical protein [SAR324 cluster bacterium]